jgi:cation diffusion facilitator CzcD-associated flavoprotein CzcO
VKEGAVAEHVEKYCIVGGGPSGLIMARAFLKEGIPFDLFERHSDVGGIWDAENEGSPMYDSAHYISSKYTSGFYGYPMPESYPDYPTNYQVLAYVRNFARAFGLYDHVTLNTAVEHAEPDGDGWLVTLQDGEQRRYRGLVCANGTTWHPNLPSYPGLESFTGEVRHSVTYRSPDEFRGKRVLVVGAGNSGVDIACDAALSADEAFISLRRGYRFLPKHVFGIPTDVFVNVGAELPEGVSVPEDPSAMIDALVGDLTRFGLPAPDHEALASHPTMNTQIVHHLAHGDILAKPDVKEFRGDTVVFADGSEERIDLVLFATGYEWRLPYLDEDLLPWKSGHPQLYLNVFHREIDNLYVLGFVEFADAAYKRFDEMAQLIVGDVRATLTGGEDKERLRRLKAEHEPDLTGGMEYVDSPRHANYVETHTYQHVLRELFDEFGWAWPDEEFYADLRRTPAGATETSSN